MGPKYIGVMILTFLGHVTSCHMTIRITVGHFLLVVRWTQVSISSRFRDIWPKVYWGHNLDLPGSRDVIVHVTILFPGSHFLYRCSTGTKTVSPTIVEIMGPKYIGSWPWPFWVTWRHQSRDHSNPNGSFPIGGLLDSSLYLQPFSRYLALSISGSRPWPFWVTWRHRSRDHSNPNGPFPIGGPLDPQVSISIRFRDIWH